MRMIKKVIAIYKSCSLSVKAAVWFVVCSAVQNGAKFLSMPVLTHLMTPEQYGIYSVFLSSINIITIVATLFLHQGVFNNAMFKYPDERDKYVSSAQSLSFTVVVVTTAIYFPLRGFFDNLFGLPTEYMLSIFVQLLFTESFLMWSAKQRYEYGYIKLVIATTLYSLLYIGLPVLTAFIVPKNVTVPAVIAVGTVVQFAFCLCFAVYNYIKGKTFFNKEFWKYSFMFNLPLIPHFLSLSFLGSSDRVMVKTLSNASDAGIYSFTYTISIVIMIITDSVNNALIPQIYKLLGKNDTEPIKKIVNQLLGAVGMMVFLFCLIAPEIVKLFSPKEYHEAIPLLPVLSLSPFLTFVYSLFADIEYFCEANKLVTTASVISAVTNIGLNAIFIPLFGFFAAGWTTFVCYSLNCILHYIFTKAACRKKLSGVSPYDYKKIFLISLVTIIATLLLLLIYDFWIARYVLLAAIMAVAIVKRKSIMIIINSVRGKS